MSTIKIRRGLQADFGSYTLLEGELGFTTDTHKVYIGADDSHNYLIGSALVGTTAARPAAGEAGRVYHDTDLVETYVDDGTAWQLTGYTDLADMSGTLDDISFAGTYGGVLNTDLTSGQVNQIDDGTNNVTAAQARTHIDDATLHRIINDSGTSTTELWSASKIGGEIDDKLQGISWQEPIIDRVDFDTAEPAAPTTGDRYINTVATASSSVTAQAIAIHSIVEWNGVDWDEFVPDEGWAVYDETADGQFNFNGTTWVTFGSTTNHANLSNLNSTSYYHLTNTEYTDLTDAGESALHYHDTDRSRANHTGTQLSTTISDWAEAVQDTSAAMITGGTHSGGISVSYDDGTGLLDIDMANDGHTHDTRYYTESEIGNTAVSTAGAYLVGVYATELAHSSATILQDVLDDLDQAITDVTTGGYSDEDARDTIGFMFEVQDSVNIAHVYTDNGDATSYMTSTIILVDGGTFA